MDRRIRTLVIGIGNPLRADDAVGALVACAVADWELADFQGLEVHQLLPEHAALLENIERVVFVDALDPEGAAFSPCRLVRLITEAVPFASFHRLSPSQLLGLTQYLYGRTPEAWLVAVPVEGTGVAEGLSEHAQIYAACALRLIAALVAGPGPSESVDLSSFAG